MLSTKALDWCSTQYKINSKQKQFHGNKSNKMRERTLSWIGKIEEKIDPSHI